VSRLPFSFPLCLLCPLTRFICLLVPLGFPPQSRHKRGLCPVFFFGFEVSVPPAVLIFAGHFSFLISLLDRFTDLFSPLDTVLTFSMDPDLHFQTAPPQPSPGSPIITARRNTMVLLLRFQARCPPHSELRHSPPSPLLLCPCFPPPTCPHVFPHLCSITFSFPPGQRFRNISKSGSIFVLIEFFLNSFSPTPQLFPRDTQSYYFLPGSILEPRNHRLPPWGVQQKLVIVGTPICYLSG